MNGCFFWPGAVLAIGALATTLQAAEPEWQLLQDYCSDCHNLDDQAGGVAFDVLPRDHLSVDAAVWEMALRKIRTGLMPPAGKPRPQDAELAGFVASLEQRLDAEQAIAPNPGNVGMGRLNRAEYANVIRDLLAYDADSLVATLPVDESSHGFDNIAETLSISPTLIDAYVGVAMRISRGAVGDRTLIPTQVKYPAPSGDQTRHREGLPLGTRGGMLVTHNFPLDAEYEFRIAGGAGRQLSNQEYCSGPGIVVTLNGERLEPEDPGRFSLQVPAGPQTLGVALVDDNHCRGVNEFYDDYVPGGAIQSLEINGPFDVAGTGDTPSRRAIFSCYPESSAQEKACARNILTSLASRGYRRPLPELSPEVEMLMQFYTAGASESGFETGIQYALSRLLIDPQFLYQAEEQPAGLAPGSVYQISGLELASRLSFFIWSSIPDQELLDLGSNGKLLEPEVLVQQVRRMLADERAMALVENFAGQWLKLRELEAALPQDPAFNASLRSAFRQETELLFVDMIREDRGLLHLLDADYTWLNETLAQHYGIAGVSGDYMRRVELPPDSPRRGLLGQGSILTATSTANRTSPVVRGAWIVENILGAPVPVPPPGVETDLSEESVPEGKVANTLRERLELHRANPTCAMCHQIMDPLGLAMENFDLVGRWRDSENGFPIDPSSSLVDGTPIGSPVDMRRALLRRGDAVATSITEKLLTYALGRALEPYDMPAVRKIVNSTAEDDYRFSAILLGIVQSLPFQYKTATDIPQQTAMSR